jgi:hypothetical protein
MHQLEPHHPTHKVTKDIRNQSYHPTGPLARATDESHWHINPDKSAQRQTLTTANTLHFE